LDLWITDLFYDPHSQSFPLNELWWIRLLYDHSPNVNRLTAALSLLALLWAHVKPQHLPSRWLRRVAAWLLVMVLGLGVLVDWVLKDHFGRPHPYQTLRYNGSMAFVPVLNYEPLCEANCSFVSGHAAGGFIWMAWGMWGARSKRRRWLGAGLLAGGLIGATRIMQGGHYFSDVVFSGWFIWLTFTLIREVWLRQRCLRIQSLRTAPMGENPRI
jgi:lipid A 4'-phosphatase